MTFALPPYTLGRIYGGLCTYGSVRVSCCFPRLSTLLTHRWPWSSAETWYTSRKSQFIRITIVNLEGMDNLRQLSFSWVYLLQNVSPFESRCSTFRGKPLRFRSVYV